ncbi:MAG: hypothetical protein GY717_18245, partial [Rhodobacteraceae bacterium]|nr:hypothetical protein [Paracoccaceae bacterium]
WQNVLAPPTITSAPTITVDEDTPYALTIADFNYNDGDGDPLDHVQIMIRETAGSLQLSGVDVTQGQTISAADITAGNLIYTPAADAFGTAQDSFGYRVSDGTSYSATQSSTVLITSTFDADAESWVYADDAFGTSAPGWADGVWDSGAGFSGGGLYIDLSRNASAAISGAFSQSINLTEASVVSITLRYHLVTSNLDAGEYAEAVLAVDGVRQGTDTNGSLVHIEAEGDSGWLQATVELELAAGAHTLELGGYVNGINRNNEAVDVYFDDVSVTADTYVMASVDVSAVNDAPTFLSPTGDGIVNTPIGSGEDSGQSVTVQDDGKILVAGYSYNGSDYD